MTRRLALTLKVERQFLDGLVQRVRDDVLDLGVLRLQGFAGVDDGWNEINLHSE